MVGEGVSPDDFAVIQGEAFRGDTAAAANGNGRDDHVFHFVLHVFFFVPGGAAALDDDIFDVSAFAAHLVELGGGFVESFGKGEILEIAAPGGGGPGSAAGPGGGLADSLAEG